LASLINIIATGLLCWRELRFEATCAKGWATHRTFLI